MSLAVENLEVEREGSIACFILPATPFTTTLNGVNQLTNLSNSAILLSGTATGYTVIMPDARTIEQGHKYEIYNTSNQNVTVKDAAGAVLFILAQSSTGYLYLQANGTLAGVWLAWQIISNPNIASGILNYTLIASTLYQTNQSTEQLITGFTLTPAAGTYAVWFSATGTNSSGTAIAGWSIWKANAVIADSTRAARFGSTNTQFPMSTHTITQFNGTEACSVRVSTSAGTLSVNARSIIMIRLGV